MRSSQSSEGGRGALSASARAAALLRWCRAGTLGLALLGCGPPGTEPPTARRGVDQPHEPDQPVNAQPTVSDARSEPTHGATDDGAQAPVRARWVTGDWQRAPGTAAAALPSLSGPEARSLLRERWAARLARKRGNLERHVDREGRRHVHFAGGLGHATVARRGPDGQLEVACLDDAGAVSEFVASQPKPVSQPSQHPSPVGDLGSTDRKLGPSPAPASDSRASATASGSAGR